MAKAKKSKKRLLDAEDVCRIKQAAAIAISPDEKKIAYTVETVSDDKKKYFSRIFMVDIPTGDIRQYTYGEVSDRELVWSQDGAYLAFVSTRNKKSGIYVMPSEGGGERKVIEADGAFSGLCWTPDGKELVYNFRYNDSHTETDEKKKGEAPVFRHVARLFYRLDGAGWFPKDRFHIWKVAVESGKATQLTKGNHDDLSPDVSPDGKWVVFISNRSKDPDLDAMKDELFMVPIGGGKQKKIPTPFGPKQSPSFAPNGKKVAYVGHTKLDDAWGVANFHLWTVGVTGAPAAKDLVPKFDRQLYDQTIGDMGEGFSTPKPQWTPDGKRIYFTSADTGSTHVFYVPATGGLPTRVTKKNCHVQGYSLNGRKKILAAVIADLKAPGDVYAMPAVYDGDRKAKRLTALNKDLFSDIQFPVTREIWFKAYDGTSLQGWLVTPPKFNRKRKYPAILEIHGGPRAQYGFTFFHEMNYLASLGYVVFYTNPRGGGGRGETFAGTIVADWGSIDYQDCMAAADYLEKLPYVNAKRVGVTGGSYGGYMTNWMVGHTDRFKAAVTQRSVVNLVSFIGSSDAGFDLYREFNGHPWTNPEVYERCSPITYAKKIKTPLLIIHSEQDLRCGMEQAQNLFATLKLMKKTVEMVLFPEEPHGLSRHGRPDRRMARLDWIRKWFDRYLK